MEQVGSYRPEFDEAIKTVASLYITFLKIVEEKKDKPFFIETEYGTKEHPVHNLHAKTYKALLEGLRELGLTPKGNKTLVGSKPILEEKSNLVDVLGELNLEP